MRTRKRLAARVGSVFLAAAMVVTMTPSTAFSETDLGTGGGKTAAI